MKFEWDPGKHERNLRTRGIGFDEAAQIFEAEVITWPDTRADYGEARINDARRGRTDYRGLAGKPGGPREMAEEKPT